MKVTVIGGTNADIIGTSGKYFRMKDSNIGSVTFSYGGVGRNIANNCALLGIDTQFVSAMGNDNEGREILKELNSLKVDTSDIIISDECKTDKYLAIINNLGEMVCAVSDMSCINSIDTRYLSSIEMKSKLIAVDANLSEETLRYVSSIENKIKFLEPVSTSKAAKVASFIGRFDVIKPNIFEAEILANMKIRNERDILSAGRVLISKGVRAAFITAGKKGVYAFYGNNYIHKESKEIEVVNETGAGDSFSAGIIYSLLGGFKLCDTVDFAMKCSELTIKCASSVYPQLSSELVLNSIKEDLKNE